MTPYIHGLQKAKEILMSLSVQPPQTSGEIWLHGFKAPALREFQAKATEYIDEEIRSYSERLTQV